MRTFEEKREEALRIQETGDALAHAAFERGERLTDDQRQALTHWSMWGSDGYPVTKLGRGWQVDHSCLHSGPFKTKAEAMRAWETMIAKWIRLDALHKQAALKSEGQNSR